MSRRLSLGLCVAALMLAAPHQQRTAARGNVSAAGLTAPVRARMPVLFEPNVGQFPGHLDYVARSGGTRIALRDTEVRVAQGSGDMIRVTGWKLARATRASATHESSSTRANYLLGSNPSLWRRDVPTYRRVTYHEVYPRIDVTYYGGPQGLEFDFLVAPGGDPNVIRLAFDASVRVDDSGNIALDEEDGRVVLRAPSTYQLREGTRQPAASRFVRLTAMEIGLEVDDYDRSLPLVIDPVLAFSTFVGGGGSEAAYDVAVNGEGEAYIVGSATADFPATPGAYATVSGGSTEAFIARLSADGSSLLFATYLGGSGVDGASGVALDPSGNVYVTGSTTSPNFPSVNAFQPAYRQTACTVFGPLTTPCRDAFVAKLSPNGDALLYSTFFGGSDHDDGIDIAVDAAGQAHILGVTSSGDLPLRNAFDSIYVPSSCGNEVVQNRCPDAFVAKLDAAGTNLVFATYLGGDNDDRAGGIAIDAAGRVVAVGATNSSDFPTTAALQPSKAGGTCGVVPVAAYPCFDLFVTRLTSNGALDVSTYFGGTGDDRGADLALAADGSIWITGNTTSTDLPLRDPIQPAIGGPSPSTGSGCLPVSGLVTIVCPDAFVVKLDANAAALLKSTYLGGSYRDEARSIALDGAERVAITGVTQSPDFPVADAWQPAINARYPCPTFALSECSDVFVSVLQADAGSLAYSTYLGTYGDDEGWAVAAAPDGGLFVSGQAVGSFPTTTGVFRNAFGGVEAFVTKLFAPRAQGLLVTVAGNGGGDSSLVEEQALRTSLRAPFDIAVLNGFRYIADAGWDRVLLMTPGNHMYPAAGDGTRGYSGDFSRRAPDAQLANPRGVAVDGAGNVYIADSGNNVVRMVAAVNGLIITSAGTGASGFLGDGGPATAAQLNYPTDLLVVGNTLYVADTGNRRVRAIAQDGTITTVAGNGIAANAGDGGPAAAASLVLPSGLARDAASRLLIADWGAHVIRRVDANGVITTIAGTGSPGYSGDGGPATAAQLNGPYGLDADAAGRIFVADELNHRIRRIAADGTITTIAGTATPTPSPLLPRPALDAPLSFPTSVALDGRGNLLVVDSVNRRIGMIHRVDP